MKIVVQYRAPQFLSTLMQRLGRAARDPSLQGRGILICEPKFFDSERKKAKDALEKKRKKAEDRENAKRARANTQGDKHPPGPTLKVAGVWRTRRALVRVNVTAEEGENGIETAVDDFINAETRPINCYRKVVNIYFENNTIGIPFLCEFCLSYLPHFTHFSHRYDTMLFPL